jgi:hypothetical protein
MTIGPLSDPAVRRERARRARAAQNTIDYHVRKLVESANALSAEQAEQLRALLPAGDS